MIVNRQNLIAVYVGFKTVFQQAFTEATSNFQKVSTVVPSATKSEEYKWLGDVPRMKEWIGDREVQNLSSYGYEIKNKDFELTIGIDKNDIEDDTIGIYTPLIQTMGQSAAMHPDEIIFELLAAGFKTKCYDGKFFFDTGHKIGENTYSNKGTDPLNFDSYGAARASMMSIVNDQGKPFRAIPNLLVVPPQLEGTARKILLSDTIDATTNIYKGSAELLVLPELAANPTAWFLLDASKPVKPLIFQQRTKPQFVAKDSINDDNVFFQKQFVYGTDSRDNAGYSLWQLAYGSTGEKTT